jgi:integrase/recombinase XerD
MTAIVPISQRPSNYPGPCCPPVHQLVESFLQSLDCRDSSQIKYASQMKVFTRWIGDSGRSPFLSTWTRQDIVEYKKFLINELRIHGNGSSPKVLSSSTVNNYLSAVRKFFTYLANEGYCLNIAKDVNGIGKQSGYRKHTLSKKQVREALSSFNRDTLTGLRDYAIFNLMVRTGCRDCEIIRARIKHLRVESGQSVLDIQAKGHSESDQFKVLTHSAEKPIRDYLDARRKLHSLNDDHFLFVSHAKRNYMEGLTTRSVSRIIKTALRSIGLDNEKLTAHSLRHTAISLAIAGGASLHQAQAMAGHKDSRTTEVYFHNQKRIEEAAEKFIDI